MHHPTDRRAHTTAFVTPVVEHWLERGIAQWVHPMKDRSNDASHHERTLLPWSYISLLTELITFVHAVCYIIQCVCPFIIHLHLCYLSFTSPRNVHVTACMHTYICMYILYHICMPTECIFLGQNKANQHY